MWWWTALSIVLALLAALGNAAASVLQRRASAVEKANPAGGSAGRVAWMGHLLHQPLWVWGSAMLVVSGVCQAGALATGPLAVVQPVMTTELLFTLVVGSWVFRRRPDVQAWWAFLAMAVGLAVLLWLVRPGEGVAEVPTHRWLIVGLAVLAAVGVLLAVAAHLPSAPRATVLGAATAIAFAVTAALMKDAIARLADGIVALLTAWQTYAVVAVGLGGFLLLQLTLRAGTLVASQPALTLGDALLSVVLGAVLFEEHLQLGVRVIPEAMAMAVIGAGSVGLARSPAVAGHEGEEEVW